MSPACNSKLSMSSPGRPISAGTGGGLLGDAGLITYSSRPCRARLLFDPLHVGLGVLAHQTQQHVCPEGSLIHICFLLAMLVSVMLSVSLLAWCQQKCQAVLCLEYCVTANGMNAQWKAGHHQLSSRWPGFVMRYSQQARLQDRGL